MENEFISFTLKDDPQEYRLKFDFNEICKAEPVSGCNLMAAIAGGSITAEQTRGLLYACLKPGHPIVTLQESGTLLSRDLNTVLESLTKALAVARGTNEDEEPAGSVEEVTVPDQPIQ